MNSHISPEQRISVIYNLHQPLHIPTERQLRHTNDTTNLHQLHPQRQLYPNTNVISKLDRARLNRKETHTPEECLAVALYDVRNNECNIDEKGWVADNLIVLVGLKHPRKGGEARIRYVSRVTNAELHLYLAKAQRVLLDDMDL